jgi:hypothetical protein
VNVGSRHADNIIDGFAEKEQRVTAKCVLISYSMAALVTTQFCIFPTRAVSKVHGHTLLLRVGTLWRCGDGLFFEVPALVSDELLTTLHPLLENVLLTVCRKLQEDSGTGGFDLGAPFSW